MNTENIMSEARMLLADHGGVGSLRRVLPAEAREILGADTSMDTVLYMFISHIARAASGHAEALIVSDFAGSVITTRTYSV